MPDKEQPPYKEPVVKRRLGGKFKALIDIDDYDPELVASYAKKVKFKNNRNVVKIKGKIKKGQSILKQSEEDEPTQTRL